MMPYSLYFRSHTFQDTCALILGHSLAHVVSLNGVCLYLQRMRRCPLPLLT